MNNVWAVHVAVKMLDKEKIPVPDRTERDSETYHHITQNGAEFNAYELFISGSFHLIFLDLG